MRFTRSNHKEPPPTELSFASTEALLREKLVLQQALTNTQLAHDADAEAAARRCIAAVVKELSDRE